MSTSMSTEPPADAARKPKRRSPSYPAIDLEAAIGRTRQLYDHENQHPTHVEAIVRHWGYKSLNGPASGALAALKKFGLVDEDGAGPARRARVSDLAVDILRNPSEQARQAAIKRAALSPPIHRELWDRYGATLPSDVNLEWELTRDRGFTDTGAKEFIPEYRATVTFARLTAGATIAAQTPEASEVQQDDDDTTDGGQVRPSGRTRTPRPRRMSESTERVYTIPLAGRAPVIVEGDFPITEQDWTQLMAVLNAMKPGLVSDQHRSGDRQDG
jgi:hypothetical protein